MCVGLMRLAGKTEDVLPFGPSHSSGAGGRGDSNLPLLFLPQAIITGYTSTICVICLVFGRLVLRGMAGGL